jgi:hypothetical protein
MHRLFLLIDAKIDAGRICRRLGLHPPGLAVQTKQAEWATRYSGETSDLAVGGQVDGRQ